MARSEHTATQPTRQDITQGPARVVSIDTKYARALLIAARHGSLSVVELLLRQGQDVNTVNCRQRSALSHAAEEGHKDVVELLLNQSGCDGDSRDYDGRSPLLYAARKGHADVVEMLLKKANCKVNLVDCDKRSPLLYATREGHMDIMNMLLNEDHCGVNCMDRDGRSPLSYSAEKGDQGLDAVEVLLKSGQCDVNLADQDEAGWTPFLWAVTSGPWRERSVAQQLFETGKVDLSWQSDQSLCQKHFLMALQRERLETVNWFLQSGLVHSELLDGDGKTLLSRAAESLTKTISRQIRITERLESWIYETLNAIWNPDVDGTNSNGERLLPRTLLGWANDHGHVALVPIILKLRSKGPR